MNKKRFWQVSLWLMAIPFLLACQTQESQKGMAPIRILPIGDSITQGHVKHPSYLEYLWHELQVQGIEARFVGQRTGPHNDRWWWRLWRNTPFEQRHEGYWGWRSDQVASVLKDQYAADVALILLGSNDLLQAVPAATIEANLSALVQKLHKQHPKMAFVISELPRANWPEAANIDAFNRETLPPLVAQWQSQGLPIVLMRLGDAFDPTVHSYDGLHPNPTGAQRIAKGFVEAMGHLPIEPTAALGRLNAVLE